MDELMVNIETRLENLMKEIKHEIIPPLDKNERDGIVLTILYAIEGDNKNNKEYKKKIRKHLLSQRNGPDKRDNLIYLLTRRLAKEFNVEPQIK